MKEGNPNIREISKGTQFSSTNQPKNVGRKKRALTVYKELGYSGQDVRRTFAAIGGMTSAECDVLMEHPDATILEKGIIASYRKAAKYGDYGAIKDIITMFATEQKKEVGIEDLIRQLTAPPQILELPITSEREAIIRAEAIDNEEI